MAKLKQLEYSDKESRSVFLNSRFQRGLVLFSVSLLSTYFFLIFLTHVDVGFIGDAIRNYLYLFIGHIASLIPFCGLYWLLERYLISAKYHNRDSSSGMVIVGFVVFILCSSTLATLVNIEKNMGGFWGLWTADMLLSGLGFGGAFLITILLVIFSFSLFISVHWRALFIATGMRVLSLGKSNQEAIFINDTSIEPLSNQDTPIKSIPIHKHSEQAVPWADEKPTLTPSIEDPQKPSIGQRFKALLTLFQRNKENYSQPQQTILDDFIRHDTQVEKKDYDADTEVIESLPNPLLNDEADENEFASEDANISLRVNEEAEDFELVPDQMDLVEKKEVKKASKKTQNSKRKKSPSATSKGLKTHKLPPLKLLNSTIVKVHSYTDQQLNEMGETLEKNLKDFNIDVEVKAIQPGPVVTLFEIDPAPGVKVGQIVQLAKDLARSLVVASVRVVEVIPGKSYIGIEIPNAQREPVNFYEMLSSDNFQKQDKPLSMALGKNIGGTPVVIDLAKTPHLLVAGTTGSGKSVGINSMILSLVYKSLPNDVRLILIDPKMLELSVYEGIPHLITPVVTDMGEATAALKWAVAEMERRYKLMSLLGVRNIIGYNEKISQAQKEGTPLRDPLFKPQALFTFDEADEAPLLEKMPYIVVIIDEFADLIMVVGKQIEELIARIAQKARAAGIHLILATQRPSVNVITGLIKANIPTRLSFQVSTKIDSRTILDQGGAEQLLGLGDMLYSAPGQGTPLRAHGAFVSDEEVHDTVNWLKKHHHPPTYIENLQEKTEQTNAELGISDKGEGDDELFSAAWEVVFRTKKASISRVQRELRIGYNRAARLIEEMEQQGLLSTPDDRGNREILAGKNDEGF